MKNHTKKKKVPKNHEKTNDYNLQELREVQIENNFFIKTRNPERKRLEKWKIGRKNFP